MQTFILAGNFKVVRTSR